MTPLTHEIAITIIAGMMFLAGTIIFIAIIVGFMNLSREDKREIIGLIVAVPLFLVLLYGIGWLVRQGYAWLN